MHFYRQKSAGHLQKTVIYQFRGLGHREWSVIASWLGDKTTDHLPTTCTYRPVSLARRLARHLNKRLDSVRFHYISLDICAEFSFVYGNNQRMLMYKAT